MTQNSTEHDEIRCKLNDQLREAYGKVLLNQKCYEKMAQRAANANSRLKMAQIILSVVTTGGFVGVFAEPKLASANLGWLGVTISIIGAVASPLLLIINTYLKDFSLNEQVRNHREAANKLWKIKEEYLSLLVDFTDLEVEHIRSKRDELQNRTSRLYSESPRVNDASREDARDALRISREYPFFGAKINALLPESLREESAPGKMGEA